MTAKSNQFEEDLLRLIFHGTTITGLARNDTSPITSLYISLHTASPTEGGTQSSSECAHGSYARVAVARTAGGWTIVEDPSGTWEARNASLVQFPTCTSGSETATHAGIGTDASGAGKLLYHTTLTNPLPISTGTAPAFAAGTLRVSEG